jgi:hypothetical protein
MVHRRLTFRAVQVAPPTRRDNDSLLLAVLKPVRFTAHPLSFSHRYRFVECNPSCRTGRLGTIEFFIWHLVWRSVDMETRRIKGQGTLLKLELSQSSSIIPSRIKPPFDHLCFTVSFAYYLYNRQDVFQDDS